MRYNTIRTYNSIIEKYLQKTMNEKINGCTLEGEEKRKYLLESVNLVIREYVKFEDNGLKGYKLFYKDSK